MKVTIIWTDQRIPIETLKEVSKIRLFESGIFDDRITMVKIETVDPSVEYEMNMIHLMTIEE